MARGVRRVERTWGPDDEPAVLRPRRGVVEEAPDQQIADPPGVHRFAQAVGPFQQYSRTVHPRPHGVLERTEYRFVVPWFGWVFAPLMRRALRRPPRLRSTSLPAWAPPDHLDAAQVLALGLLAAASMSTAFVNTLFTQTVNFAAADFGVGEAAQGVAGVVVRCGIVIALPILVLADRRGRRRVMVVLAWAAPVCAATGALAPNLWVLTASQTLGRPLAIALDLLVAVVAAEVMPRNSRAYAVSLLAMASGLGAGVAVAALPLADLGEGGWRLVYVLALVWLTVALDLTRRLAETERFATAAGAPPRRRRGIDRRRLVTLATVGFAANCFVAPASFFQNRYLDDVRGYTGAGIALFTIATATPASLGFVIGGRVADTRGRRSVLAVSLPAATTLLVVSFAVDGTLMWLSAFGAGLLGGISWPAFSVYRTELFPTARRGQAGGLVATAALLGGSTGLLVAGWLLDRDWSYGSVMALMAIGQLVAAVVVLTSYPETAHRALEELNPDDAVADRPA